VLANCNNSLEAFSLLRKEINDHLSSAKRPEDDSAALQLSMAMDHASLNGGKRLRALLLLAAAEDLGLDREHIWPLAVAIERLHAASLIIDDLPAQDNADQRRGRASLHKRFDEATAQLAAISLLMEGLDIAELSKSFPPERVLALMSFWAKSIGQQGMSLGQFMDLHPELLKENPESYRKAYYLKTGIGFEASLAPAFILSGASEATLQLVRVFSEHLGFVFQLQDDLLDLTSNTEQTGKDAQADAKNGRPNLAHRLGREKTEELIQTSLQELNSLLPHLFPKDQRVTVLIQALSNMF
jgi:geranylgeranyl diphosphate synthase, type II